MPTLPQRFKISGFPKKNVNGMRKSQNKKQPFETKVQTIQKRAKNELVFDKTAYDIKYQYIHASMITYLYVTFKEKNI